MAIHTPQHKATGFLVIFDFFISSTYVFDVHHDLTSLSEQPYLHSVNFGSVQ